MSCRPDTSSFNLCVSKQAGQGCRKRPELQRFPICNFFVYLYKRITHSHSRRHLKNNAPARVVCLQPSDVKVLLLVPFLAGDEQALILLLPSCSDGLRVCQDCRAVKQTGGFGEVCSCSLKQCSRWDR